MKNYVSIWRATNLLILLLISASSLFAQTPITLEEIHLKLQKLQTAPIDEFSKLQFEIRTQWESYLEQKKRECDGEFVQNGVRVRLNYQEKKSCLAAVKSSGSDYFEKLYEARKNFLLQWGQKRLEQLEKEKALELGR